MQRQENAYVTAAAIVLGVALHHCASSTYLLVQKASTASSSRIWKISLVTLLLTITFIVFQILILDFITSPYVVPAWWVGLIQLGNYAFHFLATMGITIVLIVRLSVFYENKATLMITMYLLAVLVILSKGVGDGFGILTSISVMKNEYLRYDDHPFFKISNPILGISTLIDLIFSVLGSIGFIYALFSNQPNGNSFKEIFVHHHGYRFVLIGILHILICIFSISAINHEFTPVTHTGLYLPSGVISLELYTFLELSYVTAKEIVTKQSALPSSKPPSYVVGTLDRQKPN